MDQLEAEDVLGDSIGLFGDEKEDDGTITYGPLVLTPAPKVRHPLVEPVGRAESISVDLGRQGNASRACCLALSPTLTCTKGKHPARRPPLLALAAIGGAH